MQRKRRQALALSVSFLALCLTMPPVPVLADSVWTGAADTDWYNAGNWNPATLPTGNVSIDKDAPGATIDGGAGVSLNGTVTVGVDGLGALSIHNGGLLNSNAANATIGLNSGSGGRVVVNGGGSTWIGLNQLVVGDSGAGSLSVRNGARVESSGATIGKEEGGNGTVVVADGGTVWSNAGGVVTVGGAGYGYLSIALGGRVENREGIVGDQQGSVGSVLVSGMGSVWNNTGQLSVGRGGTGHLDVRSWGTVLSQRGVVGDAKNGIGVAVVHGLGSSWQISDDLIVGHRGTGTLEVLNLAVVSADNVFVGWDVGSVGTVRVDDGAAWQNTGNLTVGAFGEGALTVSGASLLSNKAAVIGAYQGGVGKVVVEGDNSSWQNTDYLVVGSSGTGRLDVLAHGLVESISGTVGQMQTGNGTVVLDGPGSAWRMSGELVVGWDGGGGVTVSGGAGLVNRDSVVGLAAGSNGSVLVTGAGSRWESSLDVIVGRDGDGRVVVSSGGSVASYSMTVGSAGGSTGSVTITGRDARLETDYALDVGYEGTGTLVIADRGSATAAYATIGVQNGSIGRVLVDGSGSLLDIGNELQVAFRGNDAQLAIRNGGEARSNTSAVGVLGGSFGQVFVSGAGSIWSVTDVLTIGQRGTGQLSISDGGQVASRAGLLGERAGSVGAVLIDGAGSRWALRDNLSIGGEGSGALYVVSGGTVSNASAIIGHRAGSSGAVLVDGSGSTWVSRDQLIVGNGGQGTLTLSNGAVVTAGSGVNIATLTGSSGTINIGAAPGETPFGAGVLDTPVVNFGAGAGTLNVNHTDTDYLFAATLTGGGTLNHHGGTTVMTGRSDTFSGPTNVTGGTLVIEGSLAASSVTVAGTGMLGGTGTIGELSVNAGGAIAPGRSIGTLKVSGDVLFSPHSLYDVEINASGASDRIEAGGAATLTGGVVWVQSASGAYSIGARYTILTAQAGISGTFDQVVGTRPTPFLDFGLSYDVGNVYLDVGRSSLTFASVGETRNQVATGGGLDSLAVSDPLVGALVQLDVPAARSAFDQLSGEIHASAKSALIEDSRFVREAATDRIRAAFGAVGAPAFPVMAYADGGPRIAPATTDHFAVWGQGFGAWGRTNRDGNAATLDRSVGGFLMGADAAAFGGWRIGALAGYSRTSFNAKQRASSGASDNYHMGMYGGTRWGALGLRTGLAYTRHDIDTSRAIFFGGFGDSLKSGYRAGGFQAFGDLGYQIAIGVSAVEPFANLAYVNLDTEGFSERGGAAALHAGSQTTETVFSTLGTRMSGDIVLGDLAVTARGSLGWRHAFGDTTPLSTQAFALGETFTVAGVPIAKDAAVIGAGLDMRVLPSAMLTLSYDGQVASDAQQHGFKGNFTARF